MFLLIFVSKAFNEIVVNNRRFQKYLKLSNAIISCDFVHEIYSRYIEQSFFDKLTFLNDDFPFKMYVKFELKKLRRVYCNSNALSHLLCWTRSYTSLEVPCHFCCRLWIRKAKLFCKSVVYCFGSFFSANQFNSDICCLFSAHGNVRYLWNLIGLTKNLILMLFLQSWIDVCIFLWRRMRLRLSNAI